MGAVHRAGRRAHQFFLDNRAVLLGLGGAIAVGVTLWQTGLLEDGSSQDAAAAREQAFNASAEAAARGSAFDAVRCGSVGPDGWHVKYAELHRRILAGEAPQRYAVAQGWEGLADSIVGAVTVFWMAVLTDRAFQMIPTNWRGNKVKYEWMYAQPFINWSPTEADDPDSITIQLDANDRTKQEWKDRFACGNLSAIGPDQRTVKIITNYGYSVGIFDNPYYREQMFALGLRPETAYGCAYNFLLYPQPQLFEEHAREYERLSQPGPLKIGIQIRTGDAHIGSDGSGISIQMYDHFFDCASQIQRSHQLHGQEVLWFLITDNPVLRRQALDTYGDKVLTSDPNMTGGHTHFLRENGNTPSLRAAAMDQWLFGLADFHVISRLSGFGRTGGWRSQKWHGIFTLENARVEYRDCSGDQWDSVKRLAGLGDGTLIGQWHPGI